MIGVYDYTVILTYISLLSAGAGIIVSLSGYGHPYVGIFFLLLCGLCDAFDGKVARTKADRTDLEKKFGIQIDSLSDLVAFGVLPACIGTAMLWRSEFMGGLLGLNPGENIKMYTVTDFAADMLGHSTTWYGILVRFFVVAIMMLFVLAAMIRLAYFNVTEEERQKEEGGAARKSYTGLPVTSSAIIFPTVALIQYVTKPDLTIFYFVTMILTGFAFLSKSIQIKKPGVKQIMIMVIIGALEFLALILTMIFSSNRI